MNYIIFNMPYPKYYFFMNANIIAIVYIQFFNIFLKGFFIDF